MVFSNNLFADELLRDLDELDGWPEKVKQMQRFWIGKSDGVQATFAVDLPGGHEDDLTVFTTRADTLLGVTFVAISEDHPLVKQVISSPNSDSDVGRLKSYLRRTQKNKTVNESCADTTLGVKLGINAIHPITLEKIPIYVADYVVGEYGDAAVMGVPAHDERDFKFAAHHGLPVKYVVKETDASTDSNKLKEMASNCKRNFAEQW